MSQQNLLALVGSFFFWANYGWCIGRGFFFFFVLVWGDRFCEDFVINSSILVVRLQWCWRITNFDFRFLKITIRMTIWTFLTFWHIQGCRHASISPVKTRHVPVSPVKAIKNNQKTAAKNIFIIIKKNIRYIPVFAVKFLLAKVTVTCNVNFDWLTLLQCCIIF